MGNMKVLLGAGELMYLNGACFRVDRKVTLELLNKTKFILGDHLISADEADNPMKQLYFAIQLMIMHPNVTQNPPALYRELLHSVMERENDSAKLHLLKDIDAQVQQENEFSALKIIREHFL